MNELYTPIQRGSEGKLRQMIKELLKYDITIGFKSKHQHEFITDQDKKHIRIMSILQIAKNGQIDEIMNREFTEKFIYDKEDRMAYYCIRFCRRKEGKNYADC